jgi:hypothetical protein
MWFETKRTPALLLRLIADVNPLVDQQSAASLLSVFADAGPLRPTKIIGEFRGVFEPDALANKLVKDAAKAGKLSSGTDLVNDDPALRYMLLVDPSTPSCLIRAEFSLAMFTGEDALAALVTLVRALADQLGATFACGHDKADVELSESSRPENHGTPTQIDEVYWLTLWGRGLVEVPGRERVLSTPGYRVEELPYGGVLLLTRPTPSDFASPEAREAQTRALAHLRPDLSEAAIREAHLERSRHLAPVERTFDPDVAELLAMTLQDVRIYERERETERLNTYRPPAVSEVRARPLAAQGDVAAAIEGYGGMAERIVALLREDIPEVEAATPDVLPKIDFYAWHFRYATFDRVDVERDLIPALGAYLGEMMVARLGGTWVPRRKLDESQVVIDGVAYLPFLRARHALESRQAQIDHSLTQFFRVAARGACETRVQ